MPVEFLSDEQAEAYGKFAEEPTRPELERFFFLDDVDRAALDHGVTVRRGQGCTLRVSTTPAVHRQLLARCRPLDGARGVPVVPAQRKARREYENHVNALASTAGP